MNVDNFIVRPRRREVERFQSREAWNTLDLAARTTLTDAVAGLPSAFRDDSLPAKQFDLTVLSAQIALLSGDGGFTRCQKRITDLASALEALANVPLVKKELDLILEFQTDEFWTDITVEMLETVRRRLRTLVELIEPRSRKVMITDFEDEIGSGTGVDLPQLGSGLDKARFKMKARQFVEINRDHIAILKLRRGEQLMGQDLAELERIWLAAGFDDITATVAMSEAGGMPHFLRSLTGMDRTSAKAAFSTVTGSSNLNADQIELLDLIIDTLTENGEIDPSRFYESPFTDIDTMGIGGVFGPEGAKEIIRIVRALNAAVAA